MFTRPLNDLPALNAVLNFTSAVLLLAGWVFIKRGAWRAHGFTMIGALVSSATFLSSYLYYHLVIKAQTVFAGPPVVRTIYLSILITHIILAIGMVPFILKLVYHAARRQWDRHRRTARYTLPVWSYVSITGVVVYVMLYQIY